MPPLADNINDRERDKFGFESGQTLVYVKDISAGGSSSGSVYDTNDIDEAGAGITYIGKQLAAGDYLILKIDESANPTTFRYADLTSNPTRTTYSAAWSNRATLIYGIRG